MIGAVALATALLWAGSAGAATFTVNTAADGDDEICSAAHCTLREAINASNGVDGDDVIAFSIGDGGFVTIRPFFALPTITDAVFIDGFSQLGGTGTAPEVEIDGSVSDGGANGLWITASDTRVRGLVVNRWPDRSILIEGGDRVRLEGNYLGTDSSGLLGLPGNATAGLEIRGDSTDNVIGGSGGDGRNVVTNGIQVRGAGSSGTTLIGNHVGVGVDGVTRINTSLSAIGVWIDGAPSTTVGSTVSSLGNVISGNLTAVATTGATATGAVILGNLIGTDDTGKIPVGNTAGVSIGSPGATVGGSAEGAGNLIGANGSFEGPGGGGVFVDAAGAVVQGNVIGQGGLGNSFGVVVDSPWTGVVVEDNVVGFNTGVGIAVNSGDGDAQARLKGNRIAGNGGLGIDLGPAGVTPNDPGDDDGGPNGLQNFPVITSVKPAGAVVSISGTIASAPSTLYAVEVFASDACDPSGNGEGAQVLGSVSVTTDVNGAAAFALTVPAPTGGQFTATASDPAGNTSEFGPCASAAAAPTVEKIVEPVDCTDEAAEGVTLGFDEFGGGVNVGSLYAETYGLHFLDDELRNPITYTNSDDRTTSSPPTSVINDGEVGVSNSGLAFVMSFDRDQTEVGFFAGNGFEGMDDATLTAYDGEGAVIGFVTHPVRSQDVSAFFGIRTLGTPIRKVALDYGETTVGEEIDDLCFRSIDGGPAAVTNLALEVEEASIHAGVAKVPLAAIPASWIPFVSGAPVAKPSDAGVGDIPIGDIPIGDIPIGDIGVGGTPIGDIPIGDIPIGDIAGGQDPLSLVLLSSLPSPALVGVVAGTPLEARPFQTLTLRDVYDDPVARARFEALSIAGSGLGASLLGGLSIPGVLLGDATLSELPPPAADWCSVLTSCAGVDESTATVVALELTDSMPASAPIGDIPIGDIPIGDIPIGDVKLIDVDLGSSRLGDIPIADLASPSAVVDCARVACATATLGDAAALTPSAILPTATVADLNGALGSITVGELAIALLARSDYRWTAFDPNGMQSFAGTGETAHYRASLDAVCVKTEALTIAVGLPEGFLVVPGSARLAIDGADAVPAPNPGFDREFGLRWRLPGVCTTTARHFELTFEAYAGLVLGTHTASAFADTPSGSAVSVDDAAAIRVVENHEENETLEGARPIEPNQLVVLHVGSSLDRETFTLPSPPRGWVVEATLDQVPEDADFDLSATVPAPQSQLADAPIGDISLGSLPLSDPGMTLGTPESRTLGAETLHDIPVPSSPTSTPIGDIPIGDIPIGDIPIGDISARRSSESERVRLISSGAPGPITLEVSGYNGSRSPEHAVLGVRLIPPPPLPPCPPKRFAFDSDPYAGADEAAHLGTLPATLPAATKTLFLVARDRMFDAYGTSTTAMLTSLATVAARPEVGGYVLNVDWNAAVRDALRARDANPCSTDAVNAVPRAINALVARYRTGLPQLRNIVVVGGDEQIAMTRVTDLVTLSPEFDYAKSLAFTTNGLTEGNALYAAAALGYFLTDDALATFRLTHWRDRELYLPELALSRLVESPAEIRAQLDRYVAAGGRLDPSTLSAITAEIDFLAEGNDAIGDAFAARFGAGDVLELAPLWDSVALLTGRTGRGVWSLNAHHDHYRVQPDSLANGVVGSGDLLPAPADPALPGFASLVSLTMGCHAGTSVSDDLIASPDTAEALQLRDLGQANAQNQAAVYIANTGFGYGETAPGLTGYSEKLMALIGEELAGGVGSFGEAVVRAKHRFFRESGTYNDYDFKVIQQATVYGLGVFAFSSGGTTRTPPAAPPVVTDPVTGLQSLTFDFNVASSLSRTDTPEGSFWSANGNASIAHFRMPQPLVTRDFSVPGFQPRGVELVALSTNDIPGVDPFLSTPTVACPDCEPESQYTDAIYPASFGAVNSSRLFGQRQDTVALVAGQFRPTTPAGALGVERLVHSASVRVYSSSSPDRSRPLFVLTGATGTGGQTTIWTKVVDRGTGVKKVSALWTRGGSDPWHYVQLAHVSGALYTASVPTTDEIHVMYGAIDGAGNSGASTKKGFLITSHAADPAPPAIVVSSPVAGQTLLLNQKVPAAYACSDDDGVRTCAGPSANRAPIPTGQVGPQTFTVEAEDLAGNRSTASVPYVVLFGTGGFLPPLGPGLNSENAGRTIPVKWQLRDGAGALVRALSSVASIETIPLSCTTRAVLGSGLPLPLSELRFNGDHFHYNWRTVKSQAGTCVRFAVNLSDGSARTVDIRLR